MSFEKYIFPVSEKLTTRMVSVRGKLFESDKFIMVVSAAIGFCKKLSMGERKRYQQNQF